MSYQWLHYHRYRVVAVVAAVVGGVALLVGWLGVSGSSLVTEQFPFLASGAVGGLFALGVGATLWLSADLRDEFGRLDDIYHWLQSRDQQPLVDLEADMMRPEPVDTPFAEPVGLAEPVYMAASPRRRPLRARPRADVAEP